MIFDRGKPALRGRSFYLNHDNQLQLDFIRFFAIGSNFEIFANAGLVRYVNIQKKRNMAQNNIEVDVELDETETERQSAW